MEVFAFLLIFLIRNNQNFIIVPHSKLTKKVLDSPQGEVNRKPCLGWQIQRQSLGDFFDEETLHYNLTEKLTGNIK